jgi:N-glycosylase/DNA lyase
MSQGKLVADILELKKKLNNKISKRLSEFKSMQLKSSKAWFGELCFCLLTSNARAQTAWNIQKEIGLEGFVSFSEKQLIAVLRKHHHRFHNTKSHNIVLARKYLDIKSILKDETYPREWLVKNIKGLSWKESSHFLRNIGYTDYAIIDRHVKKILIEYCIVRKIPITLSEKTYKLYEKKLKQIADSCNMSQAELDMYLFYIKTEKILK